MNSRQCKHQKGGRQCFNRTSHPTGYCHHHIPVEYREKREKLAQEYLRSLA